MVNLKHQEKKEGINREKLLFRKRAYLKTLEAIIAMVFTFAFVLYMMPMPENTLKGDTTDVLISLMTDDSFRVFAVNITSCIYKEENQSINLILDEELKSYLNYSICSQGETPRLPRKKVNAESLYLTGNLTNQTSKVVRLYYWE